MYSEIGRFRVFVGSLEGSMKEPSIFKPWKISYEYLGRRDNLPEYFCFFSASAWELVLADIPENFPMVVDWFGVFASFLLFIFGEGRCFNS